jgi:mono/diheme cytochrome c family protein
MFDILGTAILLLLAGAFAWLVRLAWRAGQPLVKWLGTALAGLLTLVPVAALGLAAVGYWKLNRTHDNPVPEVTVAVTPERVARGERFEPLCSSCHAPETGASLAGRDFLVDAPPIGRMYAPNLTPAHLADWSDGEIIRAIREGIHRHGRALMIMPSSIFRNLSDADAEAIVAWLRSLEPVEPDTPPTRLNVLGAMLVNFVPVLRMQEPITEPVTAPPPGPTAAYGAYLTSISCEFCHGAKLLGDPVFEAPGLIAAGIGWSGEQFVDFIRTGRKPSGSESDPSVMPWKDLSAFFDDDDLLAIHAHLATLAP